MNVNTRAPRAGAVAALLIASAATARADDYWLKQTLVWTAGTNDASVALAVDASGNVYQAVQLGDLGQEQHLLAKRAPSGGILWYRFFEDEGVGGEIGGVAVDALGNAYVTGTLPTAAGGVCLTQAFDAAGELRWIRTLDGGHGAACHDVAVDAAGELTVVGRHQPAPDAAWAMFLVRYGPLGEDLCAALPVPGGANATDVAVDAAGRSFVLGQVVPTNAWALFELDSRCGRAGAGYLPLPGSGYAYRDVAAAADALYAVGSGDGDLQVVKLARDGAVLKAVAYEDGGWQGYGDALALDADGNVYVGGRIGEAYVAIKFDRDLGARWSDAPGFGSGRELAVAVDAARNIYVAGTAASSRVIAEPPFGEVTSDAVMAVFAPGVPPPPPTKRRR